MTRKARRDGEEPRVAADAIGIACGKGGKRRKEEEGPFPAVFFFRVVLVGLEGTAWARELIRFAFPLHTSVIVS